MNIVIVDDEKDAVHSLELMLNEYCSDVNIVGKAFSVIEAIKEIQNKKPDLVFLDIEMPHGTGFDILDSIPDRKFEVIFVTAYNDYAIKAIKAMAADYIMKPMDIDELISAVDKIKIRIKEKDNGNIGKFLQIGNSISQLPVKIAIHTLSGVEFVDTTEIVRIEAAGSYSNVFMNGNKKIVSSKNLKEFQNILNNEYFFRAHNSHLINLIMVKRFLKNENMIEMNDGSIISLSRRNREDFIRQMEKMSN
ncbi:MAG TPA: LytTR family DNA-binding domain-containing protein [Bacteroidales bacterium]|nr:LytTR family DNA-binding domain-containing protein [Bacteroidales bacterium]HPS15985.1 LytTR family DNA-binding domain-containing protein [Bacteroidales bacterium]